VDTVADIIRTTALPKSESDTSDVRPIAMGETYRKLASSLLMNKFQSTISTLTSDTQLGVGCKCGPEKIVHLTNVWISLGAGDVVLTDFSNAFNTVSRDKALASFKYTFPPFILTLNPSMVRLPTCGLPSTDRSNPSFPLKVRN
jgi:hypothetical protein